ncbi:MAG: hypothetical protein H7A46_19585 [Verrucomicrobiales bacterium]|nr:hypothetical protein [Verrucomicrobiales bacterium]
MTSLPARRTQRCDRETRIESEPPMNGRFDSSFGLQLSGPALLTLLFGLALPPDARAQTPLPDDFDPGVDSTVFSLAVQPDGKILVGGDFTALGGQPRNHIGRLNADGTLDTGFDPGASSYVNSLAVQADGKIVVGGIFSTLGGQPRNYIGRLNADGTLDADFNPRVRTSVYSLAVQPDGKILVGIFSPGMRANYLDRLNANGSRDEGFYPGADGTVYSLALQPDGKIVVGGNFTTLGGQPRENRPAQCRRNAGHRL